FLLPQLLLNLALRLSVPDQALWLQVVIGWLPGVVMYAAMVPPSAAAALGGAPSVREALGRVGGRLRTVLGAALLYSIALPLMMATVVGIPFAIYLVVAWGLVFQALLLEELGVRRALGRSRSLVRGSWWRVCWIGLLLTVLLLGISFVLSLPAA